MGELAGEGGVVAVELLDRDSDSLVKPGANAGTELLIQGVANQRVGEGEPAGARFDHKALGDRLPGGGHHLLVAEV